LKSYSFAPIFQPLTLSLTKIAWLLDYANEKNVVLLRDVTARLLTEWRSGWTFRKDSDSPSVHWSVAYVDR